MGDFETLRSNADQISNPDIQDFKERMQEAIENTWSVVSDYFNGGNRDDGAYATMLRFFNFANESYNGDVSDVSFLEDLENLLAEMFRSAPNEVVVQLTDILDLEPGAIAKLGGDDMTEDEIAAYDLYTEFQTGDYIKSASSTRRPEGMVRFYREKFVGQPQVE